MKVIGLRREVYERVFRAARLVFAGFPFADALAFLFFAFVAAAFLAAFLRFFASSLVRLLIAS
jgi:hypothetical protein